MSGGAHVFRDGRFGCWINQAASVNSPARLQGLRGLGFTDLFLRGADAQLAHKEKVLAAGFLGCHAWWAVDHLTPQGYVARCFADIARWNPGAGELNIELGSDTTLGAFMREVVGGLRAKKPNMRLRLNIAPRKGIFLPVDLIESDPQLFVTEQVYGGNMEFRYSEADALEDMLDAGVPRDKASVCYAGAVDVGGGVRVSGLPNYPHPLRRGVVFTDDLLAEVGLVP